MTSESKPPGQADSLHCLSPHTSVTESQASLAPFPPTGSWYWCWSSV